MPDPKLTLAERRGSRRNCRSRQRARRGVCRWAGREWGSILGFVGVSSPARWVRQSSTEAAEGMAAESD